MKKTGGDLCRLRSIHQTQYFDASVAEFFRVFNNDTGRPELYFGYLAGCLRGHGSPSGNGSENCKEKIAVDFGCGTGWLTPRLPSLGFGTVYGIDTSISMLQKAFNQTSQAFINSGTVRYVASIPDDIKGKCSLVTAIHVHYHFETSDELKTNFFGSLASMLAPDGEAILVGCPSDYIQDTPEHYQNCIHKDVVPPEILSKASEPSLLADEEGYISLSALPAFALKDGTQMKVSFWATDDNGQERTLQLRDTFWSDQALIEKAREAGLELSCRQNLGWRDQPNVYMAMHFKKMPAAKLTK